MKHREIRRWWPFLPEELLWAIDEGDRLALQAAADFQEERGDLSWRRAAQSGKWPWKSGGPEPEKLIWVTLDFWQGALPPAESVLSREVFLAMPSSSLDEVFDNSFYADHDWAPSASLALAMLALGLSWLEEGSPDFDPVATAHGWSPIRAAAIRPR
jgi:hypothetical protein